MSASSPGRRAANPVLMSDLQTNPHKARSLFLSDVHLGTRDCHVEELLSLLKEYDCENIFLVGDIIDFWSLRGGIYWPALHNTVVQKILRKARHGVRVVIIPGNHDETLREYVGSSFGGIVVLRDHVHVAADGRRYALLHGDEFDQAACLDWVSLLGDVLYQFLVKLNRSLSWLRRRLRISCHWSPADYAKRNVLRAARFIADFEHSMAHEARRRGLDGVICGHIHTPAAKLVDGITYINCGDWVDSCTAVIEHYDGRMQLLRWTRREAASVVPAAEAVAEAPAS
jgi:UDP-2,3-diacylglucosamine pyrophosphatase LpxH